MVHLKLHVLDEASLSGEIYLGVRIGDAQKVGRLASERSFKFTQPNIRSFRQGKLEIFQRIGSCNLGVDPTQDDEQMLTVPINGDSSRCARFRVQLQGLEGLPAVPENSTRLETISKEKVSPGRSRTTGARYLEKHNIERRLSQAVEELMRAEPDDPAQFIADSLKRTQVIMTRSASSRIDEEEALQSPPRLPGKPSDSKMPIIQEGSPTSKHHKEKLKSKPPMVLPPLEKSKSHPALLGAATKDSPKLGKASSPQAPALAKELREELHVQALPEAVLESIHKMFTAAPQRPSRASLKRSKQSSVASLLAPSERTSDALSQDVLRSEQKVSEQTTMLAMPSEAFENIYKLFEHYKPSRAQAEDLLSSPPHESLPALPSAPKQSSKELQVTLSGELPKAQQGVPLAMPSDVFENIHDLCAVAPKTSSRGHGEAVSRAPLWMPLLAMPSEAWGNIYVLFHNRVTAESLDTRWVIKVDFAFVNLDYEKVTGSAELEESLKNQVRKGVADSLRVSPSDVDVELSKGSVVANTKIQFSHREDADVVKKQIDATSEALLQTVVEGITQIPEIQSAVIDPTPRRTRSKKKRERHPTFESK